MSFAASTVPTIPADPIGHPSCPAHTGVALPRVSAFLTRAWGEPARALSAAEARGARVRIAVETFARGIVLSLSGDDPPSVKIRHSMSQRWCERLPFLRGHMTTLREVAVSDVYTLFTLFSDPAVTAYMAPPPPNLAKFAGFVDWSHRERKQGHGLCFGIVPDGMTAAVGILQVRCIDSTFSSAEWGFVLSAHFWSTGVFAEAADLLVEFGFTTLCIDRLEARIALRNRRGHGAVRKLGALPGATLFTSSETGVPRDPELVWTLCKDDWQSRVRNPRLSADDAPQRIRTAIEATQRELSRSESPETIEPYPLFLFDRRRPRAE